MRGNEQIKVILRNFTENSFLGQMGNVGLIMAQNHASVYLGIHSNDFFFQCFQYARGQSANHNHFSQFSRKFLLGQMGNCGTIIAQNYAAVYLSIHLNDYFHILQHDMGQ